MDKVTVSRIVQATFWGCSLAVLYLALSPDPVASISSWDKANHVFAFFVLGTLGWAAWPARRNTTLIGLFAYGCLIEVLQSFTATRLGDWHDVVADVAGLLMARALLAAVPLPVHTGRK